MVRVNGRKGLFRVTRVDKLKAVARLKQRLWLCNVVEEDISLELIQTVPRQESRAIQHFLGAKFRREGGSLRGIPLRCANEQPAPGEMPVEGPTGI